jgi:hypothetical protein
MEPVLIVSVKRFNGDAGETGIVTPEDVAFSEKSKFADVTFGSVANDVSITLPEDCSDSGRQTFPNWCGHIKVRRECSQ